MDNFFATMSKKDQRNFRRRFLRYMEKEGEFIFFPCTAAWINTVFSTQGYYSACRRHYYNQETKKFYSTSLGW